MDDFKQAKNKIIPSAGREVMSYHSDVKWEDVIGVDEVKLELEKKVIRPWENKEKYEGLKMIKGILFYGPPGVGKTYLSRALGSKPGMNVISLKGSDILSKYQGDSPVKLRSFF
ncbi:AAA family ATPase [Brevibacillus porteri]|uniref:AAA family ATPase n=1 Tax=Brevibacillus porteri TaxID=2126350 RepID=UPI003D19DE6B